MAKEKTLGQLKKIAQRNVNKYIRERDAFSGCISCGRPVTDAGHYISVKLCDAMRFDDDNIHGQCAYCNRFLEGNTVEYRMGLIERYGEEYVTSLEERYLQHKRTLHKWDRFTIDQINKKALNDCKSLHMNLT